MARGGRKGLRGRGARAGGKREEGLRGVPGGAAAKKRLVNVHWILGWGAGCVWGELRRDGRGEKRGRNGEPGGSTGGITRRESADCGGENKRGGGSRRRERGGGGKKPRQRRRGSRGATGRGMSAEGESASPTLRKTAEVGGDAADDVAPEKRKRKDTAGAKMTTAEPGALEAWSRTSRNKGGDRRV